MATTKKQIPLMRFASSSSSFPDPNPHPFSNPKCPWIYDVFINFRGEDTRSNFVSHLFSALSNAGVNTFLDDESLVKGTWLEEGLVRAIEGSQVAIVVFSPKYASSAWCLDELEKIIECHETYGQRVLPVFYNIDPSVVRHQKGDFGKALKASAEKRFSGERLEYALSRWSTALTKAANFSGWDMKNYRNEAELVKEIVNDVLTKVDNAIMSITEFPVGLQSRVQEVIALIENQPHEVCVIGIWGMGGLGKTTVVKVIYNHKDVLDVLTHNTGTEAIQGLALKLDFTSIDCFKAYAFEEMKRLRLLQLDHVQLSGDYGYLSKQLRWICWRGFLSKYIPNSFYLEGVYAIDLKHSNLRQMWKEPHAQVLQWLKFLNLSHSKYLIETPDFSKLPSLEKLILKDCPSLCKIHESIGDLRNLLLINLKDCKSLCNLPSGTYKLKSVKTLILSGCLKIDKLEEDIEQMESLTTLIAENTAVKEMPYSIVRLKSIGYISLCGYEGMARNVFPSLIWSWMSPTMNPQSLSHSFSGTSSLVSMFVKNNALGDLASMLSILSNLRSLLVQCDTEFQLYKYLSTFLDNVSGVNFTELEITSYTSEISNHSLESYLIGVGCCKEVFNTLGKSISEGLATNEACDVFLPGDNYPYWLAHTSEGPSVYFIVPESWNKYNPGIERPGISHQRFFFKS